MTDRHDRPFTAADLQCRWTVLFVGFTHCPDICPITPGLLASVENRLPEARRSRVGYPVWMPFPGRGIE